MPVRVLWVIKGLGPGGAETLLAAAARAHDREHFHIECAYVLPYKDHLVGRLEAAGVRTHCLSSSDSDPRWPIRLARLVRSGDWDVVHVHSPLPAAVARLAARSIRGHRPRLVTTEHNAWGTFSVPTRLVNSLTARLDDAVFAVSDEARASMSSPLNETAVTLVHGIDVAHTRSMAADRVTVRAELGIDDSVLVIGTVANFRLQKDYPNFLRAAKDLLEHRPDVRFVVVGQGPLETETRALAAELGVADQVHFTGFRADAVRVMSGFDVFTLASSWEGLPVALMEALALGLPVVATAVGGVAEAMTDGVDAVLVPPKDSAALSAAWQRVIGEPSLYGRLARAAAARADDFDVARAQHTIEQTYLQLVGPGDQITAEAAHTPKRSKPSPAGLDIRPATAADREAILTLLQRSLGWSDDPRFRQLFAWKHEQNAFGPSPTWVALDGERVVGVRIFMRWEFVRGGQVLQAVRAVDTATDPEYQGRGLFTALTMHALDEMTTDGVHFVFNTPNGQSRPGYLKMGWREVGRLPAAVRLAGPTSLPNLAKARVPSAHWSEPVDVGRPFCEWWSGRTTEAPMDAPIRTLATNTTTEFARWRYGFEPLHYRAFDHDAGAIVFRVRRRGPTRELVQVASFGLSTTQRDRAIGRAVKAAGADHGIRLGAPKPRAGMLPLPGRGPIFTWRALNEHGMPPLSNWSLTMGDIELF